jgi:hypothetical protein
MQAKGYPIIVHANNKAIRKAFYEAHPEFAKYEGKKYKSQYSEEVLKAFPVFLSELIKARELSVTASTVATLYGKEFTNGVERY